MHKIQKMLSAVLAASMLLGSGALAAEPAQVPAPAAVETAADQQTKLLVSMTEQREVQVEFCLSDYQFDNVADAEIVWTLTRVASYAAPEGVEFHPLMGEKEMYPNEVDTIVLNEIAGNEGWPYKDYLKVSELQTSFNAGSGCKGTLSFQISPMESRGNVSVPHKNGGKYLDVCGVFALKAMSPDGKEYPMQTPVTVEIKPYGSFHTMWEIYETLKDLSGKGDNDPDTAKPYVTLESMGQSAAGYDMPYLIVAKDSAAVEDWLALCQRAETEPEQVLAELQAGTLGDYQVPVLYSNIHANEVAAADGVLEFAKLLVEQETIAYQKLTGLTEEGSKELSKQRADLGLHTPELVEPMTTFLGGILPESSVAAGTQNSGKVAGFDEYYTQEEAEVHVDELLEDVFFILVPEENVEGRMYVTRTSSGGYDLNRDNSFQTQAETRNMQHLIASYNPVTLLELHGQVTGFQVEPCSPPHEPNVEYDLLSRHLMTGGEHFGAAAVANNEDWQSYVIPMRDYLTSDTAGNPFWEAPWDDMSTSYTPQFAMLQGCVAYTVELPAYSESSRTAATYGLLGLSDYVADEKEEYFQAQLEIYARGVDNKNSDSQVAPWFADAHDQKGAEAELFRPAYNGQGENGQFFPECYLIPLDSAHQTNLQAAYDMIEWLTRNDVQVGITDKAVSYGGETYPAGTMVVSMHQAKRAVANGVLYNGTVIRNWTDLYSEGITAFSHTRGFDMVTCAQPAAYETIAHAVGTTLKDLDSARSFLNENAKSQFTGKTGEDVILSNASEDAVAAVNALLKAGKQVGMITEGAYEGDFLCSYKDWCTVADDYVLTGTGVKEPQLTAYSIEKAPTVYISGTVDATKPDDTGYVYTTLVSGSSAYNYDRMAMEMMNFATTADAAQADAVIGATALDAGGLAAVKGGVPYVGYGSKAVEEVRNSLLDVGTGKTDGMDCLGYVVYPDKTLVNASYLADGDDVFYGYGLHYFTALPQGAKVLVQMDSNKAPLEGFMNGDETSCQAFLDGIQGFSYQGKAKDGSEIDVTVFANTLTNKAHQRDEYAFISNAIFASLLTEQAYEVTETGSSGGSGSSSQGAEKPAESQTPGTFTDVPANADCADAVAWAAARGITKGTAAGTFAPDTSCTRGQAVTMLYRAAGSPAVSWKTAFTDVPADAYCADAAAWAAAQGITQGTSDGAFAPNAACTRGQIVTMLYRAAGRGHVCRGLLPRRALHQRADRDHAVPQRAVIPASNKNPRAALMGSPWVVCGHGLHWPQGVYPWSSSSCRLPVKTRRLSSLMEAAPEQSGRWNFPDLVLMR